MFRTNFSSDGKDQASRVHISNSVCGGRNCGNAKGNRVVVFFSSQKNVQFRGVHL